MMKSLFGTLSAVAVLLMAAPAYASLIGIFSVSGPDQNAIVAFDATGNTLRVGVTNTGGPGQVDEIAAMISGVSFTFTGGGTPTSSSLTGMATGAVDCTSVSAVCIPIPPSPNSPGEPFDPAGIGRGWTYSASASGLFSGAGSFQPNLIANNNITGNTDSVSNASFNPYLIGPVIFSMTFTGSITSVTSASIYFGISPLIVPGTSCPTCPTPFLPVPQAVPEPGSMILLGSGLLGVARMRRRRARM